MINDMTFCTTCGEVFSEFEVAYHDCEKRLEAIEEAIDRYLEERLNVEVDEWI
jgi:hypothetical protein